MLRDKGFMVNVTLPVMSSGGTVSIPIEKLGVSPAAIHNLHFAKISGTNIGVSKYHNTTTGKYFLRLTASGNVSESAVAVVHAQVVGTPVNITVSAVDA